jgi:hypothetical protein
MLRNVTALAPLERDQMVEAVGSDMVFRRVRAKLELAAAVLFLSSAAGCSSYAVRPGIWELNIQVERSQNKEPLQVRTKEVRVSVGSSRETESRPDVTEVIGIAAVEPAASEPQTPGEHRKPVFREEMFGEIERREERETTITISHRDKDWNWRMSGIVADKEHVKGTHFTAVARTVKNLTLEGGVGSWSMRWLRDE